MVLPLFLLMIFLIFYVGMIFADYMTLSNVARQSAREAAVISISNYNSNVYETVLEKYTKVKLPLAFYEWQPEASANGNDSLHIEYDNTNNKQCVNVKIHAGLNSEGDWLANVIQRLLGDSDSKKFDLNITYTMYSENSH